MEQYVFGIDLGGTTVKLGLFRHNSALVSKWEIPTRTQNHGEHILADIAASMKAKLQELFYGGFAGEEDTLATITALYADGYLIDTHTAVAAKVLEDYRRETGDDTIAVFASTASPYKFCDSVLTAIGETPVPGSVDRIAQLEEASGVPAPKRLAALKGKVPRFDGVTKKEAMEEVVLNFLR